MERKRPERTCVERVKTWFIEGSPKTLKDRAEGGDSVRSLSTGCFFGGKKRGEWGTEKYPPTWLIPHSRNEDRGRCSRKKAGSGGEKKGSRKAPLILPSARVRGNLPLIIE